jgi:hypothetical protein
MNSGRVGAAAPVARQDVDVQPEPPRESRPAQAELAGLEHEHAIAGTECVDQRRLPRAAARGWIDHDAAFRTEHPLQPVQQLAGECGEVGAAVIGGGARDRAAHPVRHVRGAGKLEEMPAAALPVHGLIRDEGRRVRADR